MALRAGSYNAAKPQWRGVLRDYSSPVYVCIHSHDTQPEATECARAARNGLREHPTALPVGWIPFEMTYSA
jgi:hypothetical protein